MLQGCFAFVIIIEIIRNMFRRLKRAQEQGRNELRKTKAKEEKRATPWACSPKDVSTQDAGAHSQLAEPVCRHAAVS